MGDISPNFKQMKGSTRHQKALKNAAEVLTELFQPDKEPEYSKGFKKWLKLSMKRRISLMIVNKWDYNKCIEFLKNEKENDFRKLSRKQNKKIIS